MECECDVMIMPVETGGTGRDWGWFDAKMLQSVEIGYAKYGIVHCGVRGLKVKDLKFAALFRSQISQSWLPLPRYCLSKRSMKNIVLIYLAINSALRDDGY